MRKLFCKIYDLWLSKLVNEKSDPLVIMLDFMFGSNCKYCMVSRAAAFGVGLGLLLSASYFGLAIMGASVLMTLGERFWLCEAK